MYLSLNPTVVADRVPWPDLARLAAKVGYPGVDLHLPGAMKQGLPATRALLDQLHIRPAVLGFPVEFRKDDATFQKDLEQLDDAAHLRRPSTARAWSPISCRPARLPNASCARFT